MSKPRALFNRFHATINLPHIERLIILLAVLLVMRLPSLSEPYWYGDEGIYLTIGNAMRHGERLYSEIIDHKTPVIYYLAMVPNQLDFRLLLLGWMIVATAAFYVIGLRWFKHWLPTCVATLLFILFTTLPFLEGDIPNGELFVMGFVLVGGAIVTSLPWFHDRVQLKPIKLSRTLTALFAAGVAFGLGILTKVPAAFDLAAFLGLGWFTAIHQLTQHTERAKKVLLGKWLLYFLVLIAGVVTTVGLSVIYFVMRGSGQAYLTYGLLYNFHYVENWTVPFHQNWLLFLFSLKGKVAVLAVVGLIISWLSRKVSPIWSTIVMWVALALVASCLSNRPYPHYFLQVVPPLAFLIGWKVEWLMKFLKSHTISKLESWQIGVTVVTVALVVVAWVLLGFHGYETLNYYQNYGKLMTGKITAIQYAEAFNGVIADNQKVTAILVASNDPYLFIWGTDPILYAQSGKIPVGRFTVSFHIQDLNAYDETLAAVQARQPKYVVVMNDESASFPQLNRYLQQHYLPNSHFDHLILWKWNK